MNASMYERMQAMIDGIDPRNYPNLSTADLLETVRLAWIGLAVEAMSEGKGICKLMHGFADIKLIGPKEDDEWHTTGKIFLRAIDAVQEIIE